MSYETTHREAKKHQLRSGALLAGAILLANIVVIGGVLFGLSGASHAATLTPLATERMATMLASPTLHIPSLFVDNRVAVFSLLIGGFIGMVGGAATLSMTFARDLRNAGTRDMLDRL